MTNSELHDWMEYYRTQGAPENQQMLVMLLREVQEAEGGILSQASLNIITEGYALPKPVLQALLRRVPALRCQSVPHKLEICSTCRAGGHLREFIENEFGVKSGSCCEEAGFFYRAVGCMKNCKNGPSVRWDGKLYPAADVELLRRLIRDGKQ